jgi:hypothetical protein
MNRKLRDVLVLVAACLALVWSIPAVGQLVKGSCSGTVVDQQGAVVSGAQVKATNTSTGAVLTTTTDSSGSFRFNLIPAGTYKVEASAKGFKTAVQSSVAVDVGRDTGLTFKLTVGEASTTVEVSAEAPLIETTQAQVTNTFSGATLSTFAGVQENEGLDNLALFVPGVSSVRDNSFSNTNGGVGFSVNGLRGRNNDQQIDGQNNNDNSVAGPGLFVSDVEFVQQYVLITNQFGPEYGRNSGSVVNIITKTGGNSWRGSIYGSENNSYFNSLNNFQKNKDICEDNCLTKPPRLNDEFGGFTVGGPLAKNKAFFFGGFNEEIISQNNLFSSTSLTPTPAGLAALAACFPTGVSNQALQALSKFGPYGISGGNPTVNGTPVTGVVGACPAAQFAGVARTVQQPVHNFNWIMKTDLQLGSDTITGRYIFNRGNSFNIGDNGAAGYFFNVPALSQAVLLSWTRNLSSHMVNEARGSFGRLNVEFGGNSFGTEPTANSLDQAVTNVAFNSSSNLGFGPATNLPQQRIVNTWQAQDNWNYVMGKHTVKAGVNWTYQRSPNIFLPTINGAYRFSSWSSFFANTPNRVRVALGPSLLDFREYDTFFYGGDDWKLSKNLTVQAGVTYSYYGQPANLFNQITTTRESNASTAFWNPALPLSVRTLPIIPAPKNSFGPSVGFAWSPQWGGFLTGNGKTTFRGGYRMLYDPPFYNIYLNVSTSAPEVFLQTVSAPATHPLPAVPTGPNVRASLASALTPGVFDPRTFAQTNVTPNFGPDKVQSWSLGFEREVTKNAAFEARYVGNHAYNLFQTLNGNPLIGPLQADFPNLVPAGLTPCTTSNLVGAGSAVALGRASCDEGILRTRSNTGYSNYHAAQVEFRAANLFKQLLVRTSYTYSKTLDNVSEIFSTFGAGNSTFVYQNPSNPNAPGEYSFSGLDYPHQWSILFTESLPFFKDQHGLAGHVLGGWSVSGNYILASGQRYSPSQLFLGSLFAQLGLAPDYYDVGYFGNFNSGVEPLRAFMGNLSAPTSAVGIMAGDACNILDAGTGTCTIAPTTLLSLNAMGPNCLGPGGPCAVVPVTKDQVRFIINSQTSQSVFGTPFGNAPRNVVANAITNLGSFAIMKNFKLGEHTSFEFRSTLLNAFNHPNFTSVDPFVDDAGLHGAFNGFGDVTQTPSISRRIIFGGVVRW